MQFHFPRVQFQVKHYFGQLICPFNLIKFLMNSQQKKIPRLIVHLLFKWPTEYQYALTCFDLASHQRQP